MLTSLLLTALVSTAASPTLEKPSRFSVVNRGGIWSFVTPQGQTFWSLGTCCTDPGTALDKVNPKNPSYTGLKLFSTGHEWGKDAVAKLRSWGFNSLGGWSDETYLRQLPASERLPYFKVLHLGAYNKAPYSDIFSKETRDWVYRAAKEQIPSVKDDPFLVGYFSDNELGWWDGYLFRSYLEMPADSPGRQALLGVIKKHYRNSFTNFQKDWITGAHSFEELGTKNPPKLRPGQNGVKVVNAWMYAMGDYYYRLMREAIQKYDSSRLILGDRYCQYYSLPIALSSAKYIDVASTNMGADWTNGDLSKYFLNTLYEATKKPIVISEFYMAAMENRSGNKNDSGGFPVVQTQRERADSFGHNLQQLLENPNVIGAHWFQFYDEPTFGRADGENYNMGMVDIHGVQYDEMIAKTKSLDLDKPRKAVRPASKAAVEVPSAPTDATVSLRNWNKAGFIVPTSRLPLADLYAVADKDSLYIGLYAMDYIDEELYVGKKLPAIDRPLLKLKFAGWKDAVDIRFGGEKQLPTSSDSRITVTSVPGLKITAIAKIPRSLVTNWKLDAEFFTHGRGYRTTWQTLLEPRP
ncbi:MAG: hypothetical protein ACOYON_01885 [Fimbriimonas sp.]